MFSTYRLSCRIDEGVVLDFILGFTLNVFLVDYSNQDFVVTYLRVYIVVDDDILVARLLDHLRPKQSVPAYSPIFVDMSSLLCSGSLCRTHLPLI